MVSFQCWGCPEICPHSVIFFNNIFSFGILIHSPWVILSTVPIINYIQSTLKSRYLPTEHQCHISYPLLGMLLAQAPRTSKDPTISQAAAPPSGKSPKPDTWRPPLTFSSSHPIHDPVLPISPLNFSWPSPLPSMAMATALVKEATIISNLRYFAGFLSVLFFFF